MATSSRTLAIKIQPLGKSAGIWRALFPRCVDQTPFTSYAWYHALCKHILKREPDVVTIWHDDRPVGLLPAETKYNTIRTIIDERITDLTDIIIEPGFEQSVMESLAAYITDNDLRIDLSPLEASSMLVQHLSNILGDISIVDLETCPYLPLPDSWDEYLKILSGKHRHELRRKMRRAEGIELHEMTSDQLNLLFDLMAKSDRKKKEFLTEDIRSFFKQLISAFAHENWLRMRLACMDNKPAAILLAFHRGTRICLYNSGYDPRYSNLSPGIAAIVLDIKHAIQEEYSCYDFLRGQEKYKLRFGTRVRKTKRVQR